MRIVDKTSSDRSSNGSITNPKIKGIVKVTDATVTLDWIEPSVTYLHVVVGSQVVVGEEKLLKPFVFFDSTCGFYRFKADVPYTASSIVAYRRLGVQQYPYSIAREYEAINHLDLFKKSIELVDSQWKDPLGKYLKYTFGLEYETSMGVIPEELCFRDGLIPLRDGSITGNEYTSTVLSGEKGLGMVKQEVATLKKYTIFNQDCALHVHMGGYPLERKALFVLYQIVWMLERQMYDGLIPRDSFNTARYKGSGKDYCKKLPENNDFNSIFKYFTTLNYFGSLTQPHPADPQRDRKWQIGGRYYALNLINMFCYKGPKTIEFRFLRPSFNFRKIRFWLAVFNAILIYSENYAAKEAKTPELDIYTKIRGSSRICIADILASVYGRDPSLYESLLTDYYTVINIVNTQHNNKDFFGRDAFIDDFYFPSEG